MEERCESLEKRVYECLRKAATGQIDAFEMVESFWEIFELSQTEEERNRLIEIVIENYGFALSESGVVPRKKDKKDRREFEAIADKMCSFVTKDFIAPHMVANFPTNIVADNLGCFIDSLADEKEKMAVLLLVLQSDLVPYAQYPAGFEREADLPKFSTYENPEVRKSVAMIQRVFANVGEEGDDGITVLLQRILDRHKEEPERLLILRHILALHAKKIIESAESSDCECGGSDSEGEDETDGGGNKLLN